MYLQFKLAFFFTILVCSIDAQVISDDMPEMLDDQRSLVIPDSGIIQHFCDSVSDNYIQKRFCGYISSIYHEPVTNLPVTYTFGDSILYTFTNESGLFSFPVLNNSLLNLKINTADYYLFDTSFSPVPINTPVKLEINPRFKLLIRGRTISGTLPIENVDVEIIHLTDTFKTKTMDCYTDSENYWNCLYLGMFKQSVVFENPSDSLKIKIHKDGYYDKNISLICSEYDGSIMPIHLKYTNTLPKLLKNSISVKLSMPFMKNWNAGLNYSYILKVKNIERIGIGFESMMHITIHSTDIQTFRDFSNPSDSSYQTTSYDTSYISVFVGPQFIYWLTNPSNRRFGVFLGLNTPISFPQKEFYFHPFLGSRFFLDRNKAAYIELNYLHYNLDIVQYQFNPWGNAVSSTIKKGYNKFLINFGIQMCF